jgi:hypothetical protein
MVSTAPTLGGSGLIERSETMSTTLGTEEPRLAPAPTSADDRRRARTAGVVGLVLGIILTSIALSALLLFGADPVAAGIFSPERYRTQVPAWMVEAPEPAAEILSPEAARTSVPSWMRSAQ